MHPVGPSSCLSVVIIVWLTAAGMKRQGKSADLT